MSPEQTKRLRGAILEVLNDNHRAQKPRLDLSVIWAVLQKLGHNDLFKNDLVTVLQDLKGRSYITFDLKREEWSGDIRVSKIEITPSGRDVLEGTIEDRSVLLD
jgi:hypothetical protein